MCRWIERFNNKLRQPAKKEEARRMKQFVNDAFAQDPRILQRRAEEKAQRYAWLFEQKCEMCLAISPDSRRCEPNWQ